MKSGNATATLDADNSCLISTEDSCRCTRHDKLLTQQDQMPDYLHSCSVKHSNTFILTFYVVHFLTLRKMEHAPSDMQHTAAKKSMIDKLADMQLSCLAGNFCGLMTSWSGDFCRRNWTCLSKNFSTDTVCRTFCRATQVTRCLISCFYSGQGMQLYHPSFAAFGGLRCNTVTDFYT